MNMDGFGGSHFGDVLNATAIRPTTTDLLGYALA